MCDYSLMAVPNRLAREGEDLVVHRFPTGSLGLAGPASVRRAAQPPVAVRPNLWTLLKEFLAPARNAPVAAVCIPPGARLYIGEIPVRLQRECGVSSAETVTFTQLTAAVNTYRDAIRFANGRRVRLQELREGQPVRVLDLRDAVAFEPAGWAGELTGRERAVW